MVCTKNKTVRYMLALLLSRCLFSAQGGLIDAHYIANVLTHETKWSKAHGAQDDYLGVGMLYYAIVYIKKAQFCVCLGSGGGFVPRVMRQAQRDVGLNTARTILVDGNMGVWGRPAWLKPDSFFRKQFPDVEIIIDTTHNVAVKYAQVWKIDYLHIDADHSFNGAYQDFKDYLPLMAPQGVITLHDTAGKLPCAKVIPLLQQMGYEFVNFAELGAGTALLHLGKLRPRKNSWSFA